MTTNYVFGWKLKNGKAHIAIGVLHEGSGEWKEYIGTEGYTDLDELKRELEKMAADLFPGAKIEGQPEMVQ